VVLRYFPTSPNKKPTEASVGFLFGDGYAKIHEHQVLCISRVCGASWTREGLDVALLAKMRWSDGLKIREITQTMGISRATVKRGLRSLKQSVRKSSEILLSGDSVVTVG